MPSLRKAARGKRRWVGVKIDTTNIDQAALLEQLNHDAGKPRVAWESGDGHFLILEVKLENHMKLIDSIRSMEHVESVTSSGKIRLVKSRIYKLSKSP